MSMDQEYNDNDNNNGRPKQQYTVQKWKNVELLYKEKKNKNK